MSNALSHFAALGFAATDSADFDDLVTELAAEPAPSTASVSTIDFPGEGYVAARVLADSSGARIVALQEEGEGWTAIPGFTHGQGFPAQLYRAAQHHAVVETPRLNLICACDDSFLLPAAFPGGGQRLDASTVEVAALAADFTLGPPHSPAADAPNELTSAALQRFETSYSPRDVSPLAQLDATLGSVERRTNTLTDEAFYVCLVHLGELTIPLLIPAGSIEPVAGMRFEGSVFIFASTGHWN